MNTLSTASSPATTTGESHPVNILIADDHALMRDGIRSRIESHPGWKVCGEASDGRQAVELATRFNPHVAILDIAMPELNGIVAAQRIRKESPQTEVLMLTMHESEDLIRAAMAAGAIGFLLKTDASRLLISAIESILQRTPYFTGHISAIALSKLRDPAKASCAQTAVFSRLTMREIEVLQLLAEAKTSKQVATCLSVSVKTVEAHRANILRKLDLHSIVDLVRYAVRNKIVQE
jgi:DNA-binding NarL/FixJ family response regulator